MRFAMAQPCFGSSEIVLRIKRSSVPWTRSFGFAILWLSTTVIVDCQGVRGEDWKRNIALHGSFWRGKIMAK